MKQNFNLLINGIGGQGIITLLNLIGQAAFLDGYDVRSSELHGLSQRGGSVITHLRFGEEINSPLVGYEKADLIISLEMGEALRALPYSSGKTKFLIADYLDTASLLSREEIENILRKLKRVYFLLPAYKICKEKLQNEMVGGIYIAGYAIFKNFIPINKKSFEEAIRKIIPEKYQELNIKAFNLAFLL